MDVRYGSFIWDADKEKTNAGKHGVDFKMAARAFLDERRVNTHDSKHSRLEERWFCIGNVDGRIVTVRYTFRAGHIRIIGAGTWRKGKMAYEKANRR